MPDTKVKYKKISWKQLVAAAEKDKKDERIVVYEFSNGRKFSVPQNKPSSP